MRGHGRSPAASIRGPCCRHPYARSRTCRCPRGNPPHPHNAARSLTHEEVDEQDDDNKVNQLVEEYAVREGAPVDSEGEVLKGLAANDPDDGSDKGGDEGGDWGEGRSSRDVSGALVPIGGAGEAAWGATSRSHPTPPHPMKRAHPGCPRPGPPPRRWPEGGGRGRAGVRAGGSPRSVCARARRRPWAACALHRNPCPPHSLSALMSMLCPHQVDHICAGQRARERQAAPTHGAPCKRRALAPPSSPTPGGGTNFRGG